MNLHIFLSTLRARFGVFALVVCATLLTAIVVSLLLPKTYKATVSLLVADREESSQSLSAAGPAAFIHPLEKVNYLQTQVDIIKSEKVARRVAQDLKLAESPNVKASFDRETGGKGAIEDWLGRGLLSGLKVETSQSNTVNVNYTARDPRFAALAANAFAKAYMDTTLELRTEPAKQASAWFDEQLKTLRVNLEEAQGKLIDYQRSKGIVSVDERFDVEAARIGDLSSALARAQDARLSMQTRDQYARDYVGRGEAIDKLPDVISNTLVQTLKADLARSEARLQELSAQYGTNFPSYQRQLSETRSLRERLDAETKKIASGIENSSAQIRQHEAGLAGALAAQRERVLRDREGRAELAVLMRNAEAAQRTYDTALTRAVATKVDSRARQNNIAVLNPAAEPQKAARPNIPLNIGLALVVGAILGLGIVLLLEMLDRRVRSRSDLALQAGVPLLGVLHPWDPGGTRLLGWTGGGSAPRQLSKPV